MDDNDDYNSVPMKIAFTLKCQRVDDTMRDGMSLGEKLCGVLALAATVATLVILIAKHIF